MVWKTGALGQPLLLKAINETVVSAVGHIYIESVTHPLLHK